MARSPKDTFLLIDANSLLHRAFHALPPFSTKDGTIVNGVYGSLSTLLKAIKEFHPEYIAAAFDLPGKTFRHKAYKGYKATREKAVQELYDQLPMLKDALRALHIPVVEKEGFEADDIIGTLSVKGSNTIPTIILTSDMDALQLVSKDVQVFRLRKGVTDLALFTPKQVTEQYGISPEQIIDYKALRGDTSDNIPGVKGIGEKTAVTLLQTFTSLDGVYAAVDKNDSRITGSVKAKLLQGKEDAYMSKQLATIVRDVPLDFSLDQARWKSYDIDEAKNMLQRFEFSSLIPRLPSQTHVEAKVAKEDLSPTDASTAPTRDVSYTCITTLIEAKKILLTASKQKAIAVDTETTSTDALRADLLAVSMSWKAGEAYVFSIQKNPALVKELKSVLENPAIQKYGHNIKYDAHVLRRAGIALTPLSFDSMIAAYLLRPGVRAYDLSSLAFKEFGHRMQEIEELIGKGKQEISMADVPLEKLTPYACADADFTFQLVEKLQPQLVESQLLKLFSEIEMPLVEVLQKMEREGVAVDTAVLQKLDVMFTKEIKKREQAIFTAADTTFNINSPLQLKKVLFEDLQLSTQGIKKTKTGISTAASELEKLQGQHPIIDDIMAYREYVKLQNTYIQTLPKLIHPETGRVHTSYNQTIAATGRLSSSDPNLQNIPIRTDLGNKIREAFIAPSGTVLVSADYSQVELRIVASLAKDEKMIEAFQRGEDIHRRTAAYMFEVPLDEVTDEMRSSAKEVNFGVLYGMGVWGLAARRKISQAKAQDFIERYFSVYHNVYEYLEQTRVTAQEQGYVETLFGRRRYLPEIYSGMRQVRAQAERMAVNFPVQGTAADIMKIAMIRIHRELPLISAQTKMMMQVHDELVFEVPKTDEQKVGAWVKQQMESVADLAVPLRVDVATGKNWASLEEVV